MAGGVSVVEIRARKERLYLYHLCWYTDLLWEYWSIWLLSSASVCSLVQLHLQHLTVAATTRRWRDTETVIKNKCVSKKMHIMPHSHSTFSVILEGSVFSPRLHLLGIYYKYVLHICNTPLISSLLVIVRYVVGDKKTKTKKNMTMHLSCMSK